MNEHKKAFNETSTDRSRIARILDKIYYLWHQNADLRLGQLLVNTDSYLEHNLYFQADNDLEVFLDKAIKRLNRDSLDLDK